jgi:hypothetical protein
MAVSTLFQGCMHANFVTEQSKDYVPELSTRAAIYSGIIASDVQDVMVDCKAANCTWPTFPTLAVDGSCATIPIFTDCTASSCTYSTPAGTSVNIPINLGPDAEFRVAPTNGTLHHVDDTSKAYFSIFEMINLVHGSGEQVQFQGWECAMWFCVNAYDVTVANGKQNLTLKGTSSTTRIDFGQQFQTDYVFMNLPNELEANPDVRFAITGNAMTALRDFMNVLTFGTVTNTFNTIECSSDWIEALWAGTSNLTDWMGKFTTSLTNEIRQQGQTKDPRASRYRGFAVQMAPFVNVNWWWQIYPLGLIGLSLFYLFYTITVGAQDGISVWKGDSLPMLFCRIPDNIHEKVRDGMDVPDGLDERVGNTRVELLRDENGRWAFKTTEE